LDRIAELAELILHHKALYYQGKPEIEDHEYDAYEDELRSLDEAHYALTVVGSIQGGGPKVSHETKMLSLDKTYSVDDLKKWMDGHSVISMFKIDGVSCSLVYEDGKLIMAKTRGDGSVGEDITSKVLWMNNVPKSISFKNKLEVRGEIYCDEEHFFALSAEMEKMGLEKPTSQRNIVAGLISRKENVELARRLQFTAFDWIEDERLGLETDKFKKLADNNFCLPEVTVHKDLAKVDQVVKEAEQFMGEGEYLIDGLVFVYNDTAIHEELGNTAHHPRYKIAFKFQGESKKTTIKEIIWSVSRNGILTPVADVEPVELSGAKISRVTLHNYGMVNQHNLKAGDQIEIIRSGEVIPKFLKVIESAPGEMDIPKACVSCGEKVFVEGIRIFCRNLLCPAQQRESILNYIQKIGMDDISSKRLDEMMKQGLVKSIADLYRLTKEDLLTLDKVKDKLSEKILGTIAKSKSTNLITFLASLGIAGGAYNKCEKVVQGGFNTLDKVMSMTIEQLVTVESFAEKSATDFIESLHSKRDLVNELVSLGLTFEVSQSSGGVLDGKKICITGTLSEKRSVIEKRIKDNGGQVVSSVSKNTDYLLTNATESSSSKFKKAKDLNIGIVNEEQLKALLDS
jgi:DNA ligase (NAD+)